MAPLQLNRPAVPSCRACARANRSVARRALACKQQTEAASSGPLLLASVFTTSSVLLGAQLAWIEPAYAAQTAGRASASKFRSARSASRLSESQGPQINNYSSTTIVAAPPVTAAPPVILAPPAPTFGISIVPVIPIPIPLPNPFAPPPPPPAPVAVVSAETAAATEAAAAAATAAAAAATAAAATAAMVAAAK